MIPNFKATVVNQRLLVQMISLLGFWWSVAFGLGDIFTLKVNPADPCAYSTVQAATDAVGDDGLDGYVIEIGPGDYHELVDIGESKQFITLRGTGADPCTTRLYWATGSERRGVLRIYGYNIRCENLTVENTTPINTIQAEALETFGDKAAFENCRFISYQDTYRCQGSGAKRSYLYNCYIAGRTDFIWNNGVGLFEDCNIMSTYSNTGGYITAAGTPWEQRWGLIFKNCNLLNDSGGTDVALGRPWREGAMTSYLNCWMGSHIRRIGWKDWDMRLYRGLVRYSEYNSTGPGANPSSHSRWADLLTDEQAAEFTRENILAGWDPNITAMPTIWKGSTGYWHQRFKWEDGLPASGSNAYIPTDCNVIVRHKAEASTVTLDGTAKLYIDGGQRHCRRGQPTMHNRFCHRQCHSSKLCHRRRFRLPPHKLFCNQRGKGKCHRRGQTSLKVDELACRSTTAEVHIINYGQFSPFAMTGFQMPAGILYVEQGSFESPNIRGIRLILAPADGDEADVTVNEGDDWYVEQIQTGGGSSLIDIGGGRFYTASGLDFGGAGPVMLKVTGGGATISIAEFYKQEPNGILAAENIDGELSTINVAGDVNFGNGAKLLLETAWGVPAGEYVLMTWTGTRTGTPVLDESVDPNEWSFVFDDTHRQLKVSYTPQEYVNLVDFASMAQEMTGEQDGTNDDWDLDGSGIVDISDVGLLCDRWLQGR
jgi:pectinesterase